MAVLSTIGNTALCGVTDLLGTGDLGCPFEFGNLAGGDLRLWKKGTVIPSTTDYNRAYIREQQIAGNLIIIQNIYDFTWNNEANVIKTADGSGLKSKLDDGKYEATIMFKKGFYNQKQLASISIDNYWQAQLVDNQGNELSAHDSNGAMVHLSTALCSFEAISFKTRSEDQLTSLTIQFSKPKQLNENAYWINADDLDYGVGELDGVNQVTLSIPTAPSDTDTTFAVKAVLSKDGSTFMDGGDEDNFLVKVNGVTVTPSGVALDTDAKTYTFTVSALSTNDVITVTTYTASANSIVTSIGTIPNDKLYKSNTATTTTVA